MRLIRTLIAALILLSPLTATAADLKCNGVKNVEDFRYTWRLKGGLRFLAGIVFPTSGVGNLTTTFPKTGESSINSELLITAPEGKSGGFYAYESEMDDSGRKTLMTYSGYAWGEKMRNERTIFDYVKRLARIRKITPKGTEDRVRPIPAQEMRDVLTAIYFLRQNTKNITKPLLTNIYADSKEYPVIFRPAGRKTFDFEGKRIQAMGFEIVDAPGGKKWPGGVKVWLSDDDRRIPFRIEIQQSLASMQLDLKSVQACESLQARMQSPR
jgi:uncharacterized protein DUF3108